MPPAYPPGPSIWLRQSNVIDMLGLLTLNWSLLERWQSEPERFSEADFNKLRNSGIHVFHPAVAFEDAKAFEITHDWFASGTG